MSVWNRAIQKKIAVRFEVLSVVLLMIRFLSEVKLCLRVRGPRRLEGSYCYHLPTSDEDREVYMDISEEFALSFSTRMMEVGGFFATSVHIYARFGGVTSQKTVILRDVEKYLWD